MAENQLIHAMLALTDLRVRAETATGANWSPKDMEVNLTFANEHQMHAYERSCLMSLEPCYYSASPGQRMFAGHKFDLRAEVVGVPFRLQVRRERHAVDHDLQYAMEMIKRARSAL